MIQENKNYLQNRGIRTYSFQKKASKKEILYEKAYFFLNKSIYIKFEYGFLIFFYLKNEVGFHKDRKFLNLLYFLAILIAEIEIFYIGT